MKKLLLRFSACFFLILISLSFKVCINLKPFKSSDVINNIQYLSSCNFKGRLSGSFENEETSYYIKNQLQKSGIEPFDGSYMHAFDASYPARIPGTPYLRILSGSGDIVKEYTYGKDYKEDMLNFKKNNFSFSKGSDVLTAKNCMQINSKSGKLMLYVPSNDLLNFRSSFMEDATCDMYIMLTSSTYKDISSYLNKNYKVSCFIPFETKKGPLNNVVGIIRGKNQYLPPIILSAHFDHVGQDLNNNTYCGALDNASGTGFMLEMAKFISSIGQPERNIIFAGFNGEELGCKGSEAFANEYKNMLKGGKVYNFDMIGGGSFCPIYIMGGKKDSPYSPFIKSITKDADECKLSYNYIFENSSDHEGFRTCGIDAVTLTDNDTSRIHTLKDIPQYIQSGNIDNCYMLMKNEIIKDAYSSDPFILWHGDIFIISLLSLLLIVFAYTKNK